MNVTFRPAVPEDAGFLYQLHKAAMRAYVEETFGEWQEDWQQAYFDRNFAPELLQVIMVDGQEAGVMYVQERSEELFLANIEIHPDFQRRGIGTQVIRELVARAADQGKPVALRVLKSNRGARSLYQRLGFGVTGENDTHYLMACYPPGGS